MAMKIHPILYSLLILQCLAVSCLSQDDFDFFYFVQQWPPSYCDTKQSCCYPTTGMPDEDFSIHGLWPNRDDGSYPQNCKRDISFDESKVSDLIDRMEREWPTLACPSGDGVKFWSHEWVKHGTCTPLDEREYFKVALDFKDKANLLQALNNAGIVPRNDELYSLVSIKEAIKEGVGYTPFIQCNTDRSRHPQLYQVYLCVDASASKFIECPVFPHGRCASKIEFPSFSSAQTQSKAHDEF